MIHGKLFTKRFALLLLISVLSLVVLGVAQVFAQTGEQSDGSTAIYRGISTAERFDVSPALRDITPLVVKGEDGLEIPERATGLESSFGPQDVDPLVQGATGPDLIPGPIVSFDGPTNIAGVYPPDPVGDVGPNHYVAMSNLYFAVYDKAGGLLYGPAANNTLWAGFGGDCETDNAGDPIVIYDQLDDRWILSQFTASGPTYFNCVAVSQTGDPTGAYYRYAFSTGSNFPDYPKYGMWPDALYISTREFGPVTFAGVGAYAVNRADLIAGNPAATVISFLVPPGGTPYDVGDGLLPTDLDGFTLPPAGEPNFFVGSMDDGGPYGAPQDALTIWEFHADFAVPANSTFTLENTVPVAAFDSIYPCSPGSRDCIPQPGTSQKIDILSYRQRPMWRLAYRNFGTHESLVTNQSVEAAPNIAGVRWYEIRDPNGTPTIYQQGTYAPGVSDGIHRWMGSIAMDKYGNMALGYSASDATSTYPSSWYTGRLESDPLGTMPQGEASIIDGTGSQTGSGARWGDYTSMNVDPVDDCTFWYVNEYLPVTSTAGWVLRIGAFGFPDCGAPEIVVDPAALSSTQAPDAAVTQTLTISNTGTGDLDWSLFEHHNLPSTSGDFTGSSLNEANTQDRVDRLSTATNSTAQEGLQVVLRPDALLYDQTDNVGTNGAPSQTFPDFGDGFGYTADDFTVPSAGWTITQVVALGSYSVGGPSPIWDVNIYADSSGIPGALVYGAAGISATSDVAGDVTLGLPSPAYLGSGTYWLSVVAHMPFNPLGQWFWSTRAVQSGGPYHWIETGLFGTPCVGSWAPGASVCGVGGGIDPDVLFAIYGTVGTPTCSTPNDIPWVSVDPLSGSTASGGSDQVTVTFNSGGLSAGSTYTGTLCVNSNDITDSLVEIPLELNVIPPPTIVVDPAAMSSTQVLNTVINQTLTISNVGGVNLDWLIIEGSAPLALDGSTARTDAPLILPEARSEDQAVETIDSEQDSPAHPASLPTGLATNFMPEGSSLYDNGPLVNSPGTGAGGADESMLQTVSQGMGIYGFGHQAAFGYRIADDFTVTDPGGWVISEILFYAYQTNSPITSTLTSVNYRIWDGVPGDPGSSVVFGDASVNRLIDTVWSGIYRVSETTSGATNRPIMANTTSAGVYLPQGTYWLDWQTDGTLSSGPWAPPITISGTITTGNGLQSLDNGLSWDSALDSGTITQQGFPFILTGEVACNPADVPWASVSPDMGTTAPGGATDVTVSFDSTGLTEGSYNGNLCVISNDPSNLVVDVPLVLNVELLKLYLPITSKN